PPCRLRRAGDHDEPEPPDGEGSPRRRARLRDQREGRRRSQSDSPPPGIPGRPEPPDPPPPRTPGGRPGSGLTFRIGAFPGRDSVTPRGAGAGRLWRGAGDDRPLAIPLHPIYDPPHLACARRLLPANGAPSPATPAPGGRRMPWPIASTSSPLGPE